MSQYPTLAIGVGHRSSSVHSLKVRKSLISLLSFLIEENATDLQYELLRASESASDSKPSIIPDNCQSFCRPFNVLSNVHAR